MDIETAPILGYLWSLWQDGIGLSEMEKDWYILSFAAKWSDDDRIIYHDSCGRRNIEDDAHILRKLWPLLDKADIVVAQNGKRFDVRKINARFLLNGMKPPSPYRVVDTKIVAQHKFALTSNGLEYMSRRLCASKKSLHKKFPGFVLWRECLAGNKEAWEEMKAYNIQDVVSTEELYFILRPWIDGHPNVAVYTAGEERVCPKCGSDNLERRGYSYTQVGKYIRFHCNSCGGWSRGRTTQNAPSKRKSLLAN